MGRTVYCFVLVGLLAGGVFLWAEDLEVGVAEPRLANGVIIKGRVQEATEEGLVIETSKGAKTYNWDTLSPGTRYRYEPTFRANYGFVLRGLRASERTNRPDVIPEAEEESAPAEKGSAAVPAPQEPMSKSIKLVDQVLYDNIEPFAAKDMPGLRLRTPETTAYWALQYGPKQKDILYLAFDAKSPEDLRDTVFVYGPGSGEYRDTVRRKALKKKVSGNNIASFKKMNIKGRFGVIKAEYDIRFSYRTGRARELAATIDVNLSAQDAKSIFVLYAEPTDLVFGEGIINVRGILDLPVLWVGLDPATTEPRLIGDLKMSRMKLAPKRGMESAVEIEVMDEESGNKVDSESIKLDESIFDQEYGIKYELDDVSPGRTYIVRASIDLGPFLGEAICEEKITIPEKK